MNFTKITIIILFLISIFIIPVNAQITNGGFETGNLTGWSEYGSFISNTVIVGGYDIYWCRLYADKYDTKYSGVMQYFDSTGYDNIEFNFYSSWSNRPQLLQVYDYTTSTFIYNTDFDSTSGWQYRTIDLTGLEGHNLVFRCAVWDTAYLDDVKLTKNIELLSFINEPVEIGTYAHLEVNLDDYWDTHANEHFYLSYDYYYKNISDYTIIDYNELELNAQNTVSMIPTYYPYFNQTGGCEIKASILYTYHDPIYNEEQLGGIGYYVSTVLINSTYEPPEEPEEPEEPEIPDPEPEPEPEPEPPIPPTQPNGTGANQSINVSWIGEYYNTVNDTFGGLCSPIYNFTNWSLSPIYSLNDSIGEFNYHMNESFTQTAEDSSILYDSINTIYGAIHPKIRNVITYYLIWVVLLIILKKD